jgi:hypothetical protein
MMTRPNGQGRTKEKVTYRALGSRQSQIGEGGGGTSRETSQWEASLTAKAVY